MPHSSTPAQYILILIDMVENQGHNRDQLLRGTTLADTGISGIGARVEAAEFNRLVTNALVLSGDPSLGLQLGMRLNLSAHALLGQAFMTCKNMKEVMGLFIKYYHLLAPALNLEFDIQPDRSTLTTRVRSEDLPIEFSYELIYAGILNTLRGLLNLDKIELRIELPYSAPGHVGKYFDLFGDDIQFDCAQGRVSFDSAMLEIPLPDSNPALRSLYEEECARLLADLEEKDSISEQSLRLLRKLEGQYPKMPQIASMLNLSSRTYRRRLERESLSYQRLLDQVRAEHATRHLQHTELPLSTIAYMVGFNDASNFRRAYARWTGSTPSEVRN
ncbi:MAG: AraC family transcriptional regulator [Halieaceae bacterium]|nr:AraC family transcriptional regulator [Halieaceae bacterium]